MLSALAKRKGDHAAAQYCTSLLALSVLSLSLSEASAFSVARSIRRRKHFLAFQLPMKHVRSLYLVCDMRRTRKSPAYSNTESIRRCVGPWYTPQNVRSGCGRKSA
ncbi:hypothetical protein DFP72DRAFT_927413 [Ephemerocybe angulata]|uniref:Uncharacterized protein n=1 Tax=Ephemerocybe angulata TaxID=980116 RepID=A0A8H6LWL6_9AGAR|nr:hypothetical protein DFP72DRAFT_927413 [Tulosesus angulatus]